MKTERIIYIADPEILAIPIHECHEPMVDVKQLGGIEIGPPPETPATVPDYTKMRKSVYEKLLKIQHRLPNGWRFRLYEGYRSLNVQAWLFETQLEIVRREQPNLNEHDTFHAATHLVSPVKNWDGTMNTPPHNTGAAVDVELMTESGECVDMGMLCKDWQHVPEALCRTVTPGLAPEAQRNRTILKEIMEAEGFINYPTEWWHYSYGDRYWAYHRKESAAIYGSFEAVNAL